MKAHRPPGLLGTFLKWSFEPYKGEDIDRIRGTYQAVKAEIENRIAALPDARPGTTSSGTSTPAWMSGAGKLLDEAGEHIRRRRIDIAWKALKAAQRMVMEGYTQPELDNAAVMLRREGTKLQGWRRHAIFDLLGDPADSSAVAGKTIDPATVIKAAEIKDEHHDNLWFKIKVRQGNLKILFFILLGTVITFPLMRSVGMLDQQGISANDMTLMVLAGVLGASFSTALTLTKRPADAPIPDQVAGSVVTFMRPVIGAAAALVLYFFIQAGISTDILAMTFDSTAKLVSAGFVAGFSERLVINVIGNFTGETT